MTRTELIATLRAEQRRQIALALRDRTQRWYLLHQVFGVVWGLWLLIGQSFAVSASFDEMERLFGAEWPLAIMVGGGALVGLLYLLVARAGGAHQRYALMFCAFGSSVGWATICGLFAAETWRTTAVPVYAYLCIAHGLCFLDVLAWPRLDEVRRGMG